MSILKTLSNRWLNAVKKWKEAMDEEVLSISQIREIIHRNSNNATFEKIDGQWSLVPKTGEVVTPSPIPAGEDIVSLQQESSPAKSPTSTDASEDTAPPCEHRWLRGRTSMSAIATCSKCLESKSITEQEWVTLPVR
jgi:hypothetical protein